MSKCSSVSLEWQLFWHKYFCTISRSHFFSKIFFITWRSYLRPILLNYFVFIDVNNVNQKCSAAMLAVKRLAGVAPDVSLKNPLHAGDKAHKWGIQPGYEPQSRRNQKSKTGGFSGPTERIDVLQRNVFKKFHQMKPIFRCTYGFETRSGISTDATRSSLICTTK